MVRDGGGKVVVDINSNNAHVLMFAVSHLCNHDAVVLLCLRRSSQISPDEIAPQV